MVGNKVKGDNSAPFLETELENDYYAQASKCILVVDKSLAPPRVVGYSFVQTSTATIFPCVDTRDFLRIFQDRIFKKRSYAATQEFLVKHSTNGNPATSLSILWKKFFLGNSNVKYRDLNAPEEKEKEFQQGPSTAVLKDIYDILDQKSFIYLHPSNDEGTINDILFLSNAETNTFVYIGQSTHKDILTYIMTAIDNSRDPDLKEWFDRIKEAGTGAFKSKKQVIETILSILGPMEKYSLPEVVPVSNSLSKPNFSYLDVTEYDNLPDLPTPAWDEFTELFDSEEKAELFRAWLCSIFMESNQGRQWLWLQGIGNDGKGSIAQAIQAYMDEKFGKGKLYHSAAAESHKSQFFFSSVYNKRLVVFGDNRERGLFKVESYLMISGGDHCPVQYKFAAPFSARIYAKLFVISNFDPYINFTMTAETSRAIVLKLDPAKCKAAKANRKEEATYKERLISEFPHYMKRCRQSYFKCLKPGAHDFIVPDSIMNEMKATCATDDFNVVQYYLGRCLEYDPRAKVRVTTLMTTFKQFYNDSMGQKEFNFFSGVIQNELAHGRDCKYMYMKSPSGIETQYVVGCRLKTATPKSYAAVLREEDALDRMDPDGNTFTDEDEMELDL